MAAENQPVTVRELREWLQHLEGQGFAAHQVRIRHEHKARDPNGLGYRRLSWIPVEPGQVGIYAPESGLKGAGDVAKGAGNE